MSIIDGLELDELYAGRDAMKARIAELEQTITVVLENFEKSEAQGYRSRDRQYAIEILRKVVPT